MKLGDIPQTKEGLKFAKEDIKKEHATGIYQKISLDYSQLALGAGAVISSAFVV